MKYKFREEWCPTIVLITSESCNLNCAYCDMAMSVDKEKHKNEAFKVKQALEDGTYLRTLKQAYDKFELDYNSTEKIDLWGQEPTLTLNEFSKNFLELYNLFPNLNHIFFSTNGVSGSDKIINFITTVSNNITKNFTIGIQFSYDGKENTLKQRGINPNIIISNIDIVIKELNKISLNPKLKVDFFFHNVIDDTLINKFSKDDYDQEELYDYLIEMPNLANHFKQISTNPCVNIGNFSPALLSPYNATQEDGKNLVKFYQHCEEVGKDIQLKYWKNLAHMIYHKFFGLEYETLGKEIIYSIQEHKFKDHQILERFSNSTTCAPNTRSLKIRYDGTLIHCQSAIKGLTLEDLKGKQGLTWESQKDRILGGYYPNIYTSSDEDFEKFFYYSYYANTEAYPIMFSQILNMMVLLLNAHQIDESYCDKKKMFRHAYYLSLGNGCPYNRIIETDSIVGCTAGWIRYLCNGFLDIVEEEYLKERDNQHDCKCRR